MFHVYRYAMSQVKDTPPPPGAKIRATKSMIGTQKELSSDESGAASSDNTGDVETKEMGQIEKKIQTGENPTTPKSDAPEIKTNTADLDLKKDTDLGMSDLKKP